MGIVSARRCPHCGHLIVDSSTRVALIGNLH
jgi:hypothetical protein